MCVLCRRALCAPRRNGRTDGRANGRREGANRDVAGTTRHTPSDLPLFLLAPRREISRGQMSVVYLAMYSGRKVAVKQFTAKGIARVGVTMRQMHDRAQMRHPNLCVARVSCARVGVRNRLGVHKCTTVHRRATEPLPGARVSCVRV